MGMDPRGRANVIVRSAGPFTLPGLYKKGSGIGEEGLQGNAAFSDHHGNRFGMMFHEYVKAHRRQQITHSVSIITQ